MFLDGVRILHISEMVNRVTVTASATVPTGSFISPLIWLHVESPSYVLCSSTFCQPLNELEVGPVTRLCVYLCIMCYAKLITGDNGVHILVLTSALALHRHMSPFLSPV